MANGFLRWKQNPADPCNSRTLLPLAPVKLLLGSVPSPYYFAHYDEDVRFSATFT